ncbi:MAG: phosphoglucosamine mutase [Chitinophagaceae bacterium]|nr:MAG: phosphoglucosamine mutase [Bacteroidetes bacterium OLB11]MCC6448893.1 phosphoglucosamine mutase [Chitinophagaceae bacterium]
MALIKSISGIRGTIGGVPGDGLTPIDILKYSAAFGQWVLQKYQNPLIVIGRDGRISGELVRNIVASTLQALGIHVIDLGLTTTPTVEMAVKMENAGGGIIITASHNPKEWNALKLLNNQGEFISNTDGEEVLKMGDNQDFQFAAITKLGTLSTNDTYREKHIQEILKHPLVDVKSITSTNFKIVVDGINSTGAVYVPYLLKSLGVENIIVLNEEVNGKFAHNPEPLPNNLLEISKVVVRENADLGIVVDPDVDRLCFINDDGSMFGEEYTLVSIADYILKNKKGNTVSNMSSTRALKDITEKHGGSYFTSAVGEVNVVQKMKEVNAIIGGEGNGGVILPELHYGRDALVGIALFLSHLAKFGKSISELRHIYPNYFMSKNKIDLDKKIDVKKIFEGIQEIYKKYPINTDDGIKIDFENEWVHLRTSNTEPIIRIYTESTSETTAENIAKKIIIDIKELMKMQ